MSTLHKPTIQALLDEALTATLVSIYMPTHSAPTPPNISEDRRRYKNLRSRVLDIIKANPDIDLRTSQAIAFQLTELLNDLEFWENRTFGTAIFLTPTNTTTIDLPIDCDEYVAVDDHFHITPLIGLVGDISDFSVLVVSKKHPMLFTGNMYGLRHADVALPVAQTGRRNVHEHIPATMHLPPTGKGQQEYFGNNFPLITHDDVLHFYRDIDRIMLKHLPKQHPLVLAGPEQDTFDFRGISNHPYILQGHIESNNSATTANDLMPFAWKLVQDATVNKRNDTQLDRFSRLSNGKDRASGELAAIQDAAKKGRIDTLLIKLIRTTADTIRDNRTATPKIHFPNDEQMAVIEKVAMQTWRNQGDIILIEDTATVPANTALGAIFRY
jgi:hypothetical protein